MKKAAGLAAGGLMQHSCQTYFCASAGRRAFTYASLGW